jgi:hypothetical protein
LYGLLGDGSLSPAGRFGCGILNCGLFWSNIMRLIPITIATAVFALTAFAALGVSSGEAFAQATCRAKCYNQEQACLKRTYNKGQCGSKARACTAKCK